MMVVRSPSSSTAHSVPAAAGQTLILVASDGARVALSRAVATEASFVLRDLLDGQELLPCPQRNSVGVSSRFPRGEVYPAQLFSAGASCPTIELENLFEVTGVNTSTSTSIASPNLDAAKAKQKATTQANVPDLTDFFPVAPPVKTPTPDIFGDLMDSTEAAPPVEVSVASASTLSPQSISPPSQLPPLAPPLPSSVGLPPPPPAEVELPFPYFTGDVLERVCRHMSYRFRVSSFGTEDGCSRVYVVKTRTIPRPMTLPLLEYLDAKDRAFISDWDELITVQMVKAATLLNYDELLQLASAKLATYLIERDVEGVRTLLGVESDFEATEEAELRKEHVTEYFR